MFIDETGIKVASGRGGDGLVSFHREKFIPKGGPDGGDGGDGGDVIMRATLSLTTLAGVQHARTYRAGNGNAGGTANKSGKRGQDLIIELPVGTLVRDALRGHVLRDLANEDDEVVIATGGRGGRGNRRFATSTNRTPRQATPGGHGESRALKLELRLVADAGLVGLPNAGKSTFLSRVSAARPKVADYPFTTLEPVLGLVNMGDSGMVLADIPGLIEGAHEGAGLGDRFLRHVARTRVLLHLVDGSHGPEAAALAYRTIRTELAHAGLGLDLKPEVVAVTKMDAVLEPDAVLAAVAAESGRRVLPLSSATGEGVSSVLGRLVEVLAEIEPIGKPEPRKPSKQRPPVDPGPSPGQSDLETP